jgi:hypothetical protein
MSTVTGLTLKEDALRKNQRLKKTLAISIQGAFV